jgi:hypothetical protein
MNDAIAAQKPVILRGACFSLPSPVMRKQLFPLLALTCLATAAVAEERHESFDKDPGWEGVSMLRLLQFLLFAPRD